MQTIAPAVATEARRLAGTVRSDLPSETLQTLWNAWSERVDADIEDLSIPKGDYVNDDYGGDDDDEVAAESAVFDSAVVLAQAFGSYLRREMGGKAQVGGKPAAGAAVASDPEDIAALDRAFETALAAATRETIDDHLDGGGEFADDLPNNDLPDDDDDDDDDLPANDMLPAEIRLRRLGRRSVRRVRGATRHRSGRALANLAKRLSRGTRDEQVAEGEKVGRLIHKYFDKKDARDPTHRIFADAQRRRRTTVIDTCGALMLGAAKYDGRQAINALSHIQRVVEEAARDTEAEIPQRFFEGAGGGDGETGLLGRVRAAVDVDRAAEFLERLGNVGFTARPGSQLQADLRSKVAGWVKAITRRMFGQAFGRSEPRRLVVSTINVCGGIMVALVRLEEDRDNAIYYANRAFSASAAVNVKLQDLLSGDAMTSDDDDDDDDSTTTNISPAAVKLAKELGHAVEAYLHAHSLQASWAAIPAIEAAAAATAAAARDIGSSNLPTARLFLLVPDHPVCERVVRGGIAEDGGIADAYLAGALLAPHPHPGLQASGYLLALGTAHPIRVEEHEDVLHHMVREDVIAERNRRRSSSSSSDNNHVSRWSAEADDKGGRMHEVPHTTMTVVRGEDPDEHLIQVRAPDALADQIRGFEIVPFFYRPHHHHHHHSQHASVSSSSSSSQQQQQQQE